MTQSTAATTQTTTHQAPAKYIQMANAIRALAMDAVEKSQSGHPGMPMGMADVATILFSEFLKYDPQNPDWADRDRFILSAGHGSMLLYALLYLTGYEDITLDEIKNFRQLGAKTAGHPEYGHAKGIETTTGPLGQGLANSVGMALAERLLEARFGESLVDHYTYVIAGDGCLMEGISHEAISMAGHLGLGKLIVLFDDNLISIDGPTSLTVSDNQLQRFNASGWHTQAIDGHDFNAIRIAIEAAKNSPLPSMIACRTVIAKGAPSKAGTSSSHGSPLGAKEIEGTRAALGWSHEPFVIPADVLADWRSAGQKGKTDFSAWSKRHDATSPAIRNEFDRLQQNKLPTGWQSAIDTFKQQLAEKQPKEATRKSSGNTLEVLNAAIPELIGGSADLTGSNDTKTSQLLPINRDDFSGRYVYYGVREHAMAAAMNGMALHKGVVPYGGTFMVFTDYCRPSIRLSALMEQRVIYVMTHDSIGLGEDGPTHQPVEHLAALRCIPNVFTYRPADATETAECWELALETTTAPSVLVLTRQALPTVRKTYVKENLCRKGGYILSEAIGELKTTIFATGSEIEIAMKAQAMLHEKNIGTRVVSMPCTELFDQQDSEYKVNILCNNSVKVAIEAAIKFGWERYIGAHGIFVGMEGFGASAPAEELYKHFGITAERVVERVTEKLSRI